MYELLALPHFPRVIQAPYAVPKGSGRVQIQGQGSVVLLKDPKYRICTKQKLFWFSGFICFGVIFLFVCLLWEVFCLLLLLSFFFTKSKKIFLPEILFRITFPRNLHCRVFFNT